MLDFYVNHKKRIIVQGYNNLIDFISNEIGEVCSGSRQFNDSMTKYYKENFYQIDEVTSMDLRLNHGYMVWQNAE